MKRLLMVISLVFLCCFTVGCQQGEEVAAVDDEADIQAIKDVVADFNLALNTGNIDKATLHYADEAIVIPPNRPPLIGKDASINDLQQLFDQFIVQEVDEVEEVQVSGELAVAHYTWSAIVTPKAEGKPIEENGNGIMVLKKQPEGVWKFTYLIWSNESLVFPTQSE
jgi:ketosteroid isomerase-like protein